jgi:hypothetical protein
MALRNFLVIGELKSDPAYQGAAHSGGSNEFASIHFINSIGLSFKTLQALA